MRPRVHVTGLVPARISAELEQDFELVDSAAGADGIVAMLTARVDDTFLDAVGPQLRVVANYGVGVDNVDLDAARRHRVVVTEHAGRADDRHRRARDCTASRARAPRR